MRITIDYSKTTFLAIKQFFNTFIQMYSQKFTAPLKKEVSTSKATFTLCLKPIKIKNSWKAQWGKPQLIMKQSEKRPNIYEQKPVNIDDLNESKEAEVKQRVEKRKEKRHAVAEKNKLLRKKIKKQKKIKGKKKTCGNVLQN